MDVPQIRTRKFNENFLSQCKFPIHQFITRHVDPALINGHMSSYPIIAEAIEHRTPGTLHQICPATPCAPQKNHSWQHHHNIHQTLPPVDVVPAAAPNLSSFPSVSSPPSFLPESPSVDIVFVFIILRSTNGRNWSRAVTFAGLLLSASSL